MIRELLGMIGMLLRNNWGSSEDDRVMIEEDLSDWAFHQRFSDCWWLGSDWGRLE